MVVTASASASRPFQRLAKRYFTEAEAQILSEDGEPKRWRPKIGLFWFWRWLVDTGFSIVFQYFFYTIENTREETKVGDGVKQYIYIYNIYIAIGTRHLPTKFQHGTWAVWGAWVSDAVCKQRVLGCPKDFLDLLCHVDPHRSDDVRFLYHIS